MPAPGQGKKQLRPQVTLTSLILVSLVCAMTAAGARYLAVALQEDTVSSRALFCVAIMVLPMLALIAANVIHFASKR